MRTNKNNSIFLVAVRFEKSELCTETLSQLKVQFSENRKSERMRDRTLESERGWERKRESERETPMWMWVCVATGVPPPEVLRKLFLLQNGNAGKVKRAQHTSQHTHTYTLSEWSLHFSMMNPPPSLFPLSLPLSLSPPSIGSNSECALGERRVFFIFHNNQLQPDTRPLPDRSKAALWVLRIWLS